MCFFGLVTRFLVIIFGILMPARYTYRALGGEAPLSAWAKYWIVYASLVCLEMAGDTFFNWLPLYVEVKLLVVLWLVISAPQASVWIFDVILNPLMGRYLPQIDDFLLHDKRHLLHNVLSYSSAFCIRSLDTLVPVVSSIWKRPGRSQARDIHEVLDTDTAHRETETPSNPLSNNYFDACEDESHNVKLPSIQLSGQSQNHSLPNLALKSSDEPGQHAVGRCKRRQYSYELLSDLKDDPLQPLEDLLRSERLANELQQHPILQRAKQRIRHQ